MSQLACEDCGAPLPIIQPPGFFCPTCGLEQGRLGNPPPATAPTIEEWNKLV